MVIKRDGRREPFEREKIQKGVERALEKRPVSRMQIESLVNEIEDRTAIVSKGSGEIDSSVIGNLIMERLSGLDKVAYIRFASVYRHFENLEEFMREIQKVGGERRSESP